MKAPKNFYNTVDQTKLGIDDLFTRTAENESDIAALETIVGDSTSGLVKDVSDLEKLKPLVDFKEDESVNAINVNRKPETTIGEYSTTLGNNNEAAGKAGLVGGYDNIAAGTGTVIVGRDNNAIGNFNAVFGRANKIQGDDASILTGNLVGGRDNVLSGSSSFDIVGGYHNEVSAGGGCTFGQFNINNHPGALVFGMANVADTSTAPSTQPGTYVEIVGNGANPNSRSNARTLDWNGNEVLAGDLTISVNGTPTSLATFIQAVNAYIQAHP